MKFLGLSNEWDGGVRKGIWPACNTKRNSAGANADRNRCEADARIEVSDHVTPYHQW